MEESIRSIFDALSSVQIIGSADGCLSALQLVRDESPDLRVADSNLPGKEIEALLQQIKHEGLGTRSLVMTGTRGQERHVFAAGADFLIPRDGSKDQLNSIVANLGRRDR